MSDDMTAAAEREEIEMLLPWYVSGRLDAADRARVESYLARDAGLRHQLDLIRAERQETIGANEALPTASAGALDRMMASLPQRRPSLAQRFASSTIYQTVADFFAAPTVRGVRFAAVAAALLLLVQGAVITTLLVRGEGGGTYQTASGQSDDKGVSALVVFTGMRACLPSRACWQISTPRSSTGLSRAGYIRSGYAPPIVPTPHELHCCVGLPSSAMSCARCFRLETDPP